MPSRRRSSYDSPLPQLGSGNASDTGPAETASGPEKDPVFLLPRIVRFGVPTTLL